MEGLNLTPLLVGLGALLVGWLLGFLDSNNRTAKKIRQVEVLAQIAAKEAEAKIAEAEARLAVAPRLEPGASSAALRLAYERGRPVLEMDGVRIESSALSIQQRSRLIELLTVVRPWLEGGAGLTTRRTSGESAIARGVAPYPGDPAPARVPAANMLEDKPVAALSLVGQIDSILQMRIAGTPLAARSIRLQESPSGGVNVYVGVTKYQSLDEVADAEIAAAIRAAIAEWESKFTPGI